MTEEISILIADDHLQSAPGQGTTIRAAIENKDTP